MICIAAKLLFIVSELVVLLKMQKQFSLVIVTSKRGKKTSFYLSKVLYIRAKLLFFRIRISMFALRKHVTTVNICLHKAALLCVRISRFTLFRKQFTINKEMHIAVKLLLKCFSVVIFVVK